MSGAETMRGQVRGGVMGGFIGDLLAAVPRAIVRHSDRRRRLARLRHEEMLATLRAGQHR